MSYGRRRVFRDKNSQAFRAVVVYEYPPGRVYRNSETGKLEKTMEVTRFTDITGPYATAAPAKAWITTVRNMDKRYRKNEVVETYVEVSESVWNRIEY